MFERALELDPESVEAQGWLVITLIALVMDNMSDLPTADLVRAEALAEQALAASPRNLLAHRVKGQVLRAQHKYDEAIAEYEKLLALNRNWVVAYHHIAQCKLYTGSIEEVIPLVVASHPPQSSRPSDGALLFQDRAGTSAAIAH